MTDSKKIESKLHQTSFVVKEKNDECSFSCFDSIENEFTQIQNEKWDRFREWIHCMCVVTFDLELGQAMEVIYPEETVLTEQEKTNICYLAFPDSNSGCMGDTQFHVRLRSSIPTADSPNYLNGGHPLSQVHRQFNTQCIIVQKADISHYWGFVYFRQKRDKTIPRGYFQKSFIILTRLPFFNLFNELLSIIAPKYFAEGFVVLQSACEQISTWPALNTDTDTLSLHILGTVFQTIIPRSNTKIHTSCMNISTIAPSASNNINLNRNSKSCNSSYDVKDSANGDDVALKNQIENCMDTVGPTLPPQILISVHEVDIFRSLSSVLSNIYTLWELVLIAEPIVVMGTSPADCSHMVQSLVSMIAPLAYCAEYRPYFTIHDSEFKEFTYEKSKNNSGGNNKMTGVGGITTLVTNKASKPPPAIIIGVTNPFFSKLLKNWPHMIRLLDNQQATVARFSKSSALHNSNSNSISTAIISSLNLGENRNSDLTTTTKKRVSGNDVQPGFYTKYSPFLKKDKALIKKVTLGMKTKRPEQVQSALLRRNLLELTQSFMIPLERYMASLMPLQRDISPFKSAPNPSQFKQDDFLATLEHSGPQLTSPLKGNWKELYKRFFKSPNFKGWFEARHKELQQTLQALQLEALSDADLNKWAQGKQEVEIVDMIIKLKQKLTLCSTSGDICSDISNITISSKTSPTKTALAVKTGRDSGIGNHQQHSNPVVDNHIMLKSSTRNQLLKQLENIKQSLPDDLKVILSDK